MPDPNAESQAPDGREDAPSPAPPERHASAEELQDPKYWDEVYEEAAAAGETPGFDLGVPNPEFAWQLEHALPRIAPGRAIVPGCGFGHEAVYFARAGFEVSAVDYSARAIEGARERALSAGVTIEFVQDDLFSLPVALAGRFDYVIEHTCFCAIHPSRRGEYAAAMARLLRPGGQLLGVFYNHGRPGGPPYHTPPEAVRAAFEPHFDCRILIVAQHSPERRRDKELFGRFFVREN